MSKHQEILTYIEGLPIGRKISVRAISTRLQVADGTAYRAIKDAENLGLVAVTDRSGTVRVSSVSHKTARFLTYQEIAAITEAEVLGGKEGLNKPFSHFAIGAMTVTNVKKYLTEGALLIVGDRTDVQNLALENQNAVLVTGGFEVAPEVVTIANLWQIPVMRTQFDTFTVASRINQSLSNVLIRQDMATIAEVYNGHAVALRDTDTVNDYFDLVKVTNRSRFAVIDHHRVVIGVISMRDVALTSRETQIDRVMSKNPAVAMLEQAVPLVSQKMLFDSYEMMPVVDSSGIFEGTVSKSDLLRYMQKSQDKLQSFQSFEDDMRSNLIEDRDHYGVKISSYMINSVGSLSQGVVIELVSTIARKILTKNKMENILIDSIHVVYMGLAGIDDDIRIIPKIVNQTRRTATLDLEVIGQEKQVIAKCLLTAQFD